MNKVIQTILASLPCSCCDHMQNLKGFLLLLSFFKQVYCCLQSSVLTNRRQLSHLVCLGMSSDRFLLALDVRCHSTYQRLTKQSPLLFVSTAPFCGPQIGPNIDI